LVSNLGASVTSRRGRERGRSKWEPCTECVRYAAGHTFIPQLREHSATTSVKRESSLLEFVLEDRDKARRR